MKKFLVFVMMMATMLYCANLALAAPNAENQQTNGSSTGTSAAIISNILVI